MLKNAEFSVFQKSYANVLMHEMVVVTSDIQNFDILEENFLAMTKSDEYVEGLDDPVIQDFLMSMSYRTRNLKPSTAQLEYPLKLPQFDRQFVLGFAVEPCSTAYLRS